MDNEGKKLVFVIGMRRSGTTILSELIRKHSEVGVIEFEPYELFQACALSEIRRYNDVAYFQKTIERYKRHNPKRYFGAKFALNPGIEAMKWRLIAQVFPKAKFVFIKRGIKDTYDSWINVDKNSVRGICSFEMYLPWYWHIVESFIEFCKTNLRKATIIDYEDLIRNADSEMERVWKILELESIKGLNGFMRKPKHWSNK